ncbi:MAG: ActS/PrrB/RegB family redox-sensitive histidine kinase [Candidatus Pelagibacter sp.]
MKFFETSKFHTLKKSTYISLRWIGIIGQLISIYIVYFFFKFEFDFFLTNIIIFIGILSNLFLIFIYNKTQLSDRSALIFFIIDIFQLGFLIYLTGGITNPFIVFLLIPSVFASSNLGIRTNLLLVITTILTIIFLTFYSEELPSPLNNHFHVDPYYYYSIPISLIIALIFLNYFAIVFGNESRKRKEALSKMEKVMAQEHEMLSLGGQAAAAAHSLGTPLSTIKIISQELKDQLQNRKDLNSDIELLISQVERCTQILKKLSLDPNEEDDFIDEDINLRGYISQIVGSFQETSNKKFVLNFDQDSNPKKFSKSIEIIYGLRNFIGNANKFSKEKIFITLKSNNDFSEIVIEDDGEGYPSEILSKIGEPYLRPFDKKNRNQTGLGLGIFIGKTLLEKNFASLNCQNSKTRTGAEVNIKWKSQDLSKI